MPINYIIEFQLFQLTLCKDKDGKIGLRVHAVNSGIFVCLVSPNSPASIVGLRFGDQILEINGTTVAGYSMDQVHKILRNAPVNGIRIVVRDRLVDLEGNGLSLHLSIL